LRLLSDRAHGFAAAALVGLDSSARIEPREASRLSAEVAGEIRRLAAINGHAEIHLAFHGPFPMAVLIGRHLNTLRTIVYEWDNATDDVAHYAPALVLEPGLSGGPVTEIRLDR
jgi:hypothetical protein